MCFIHTLQNLYRLIATVCLRRIFGLYYFRMKIAGKRQQLAYTYGIWPIYGLAWNNDLWIARPLAASIYNAHANRMLLALISTKNVCCFVLKGRALKYYTKRLSKAITISQLYCIVSPFKRSTENQLKNAQHVLKQSSNLWPRYFCQNVMV